MRANRTPLALLVLVVILAALNLALRPSPARRNFEFLPDMAHPVPYESFSANADFSDGKTLQAPPAGTVIRGELPLHYAATQADAVRAGQELTNPFAPNPATLARGQHVFQTFCLVCHGPEGNGDGIVARRGFPAPPSLLSEKPRAMKDGQIFHIITYGGQNMPSYARQVEPMDRWKAILWVRELQKRGPTVGSPAVTGPASPAGPATAAGVAGGAKR